MPNINKKKLYIRRRSYFDEDAPEIALRSLFQKYDFNKDGMLNKQELYSLLEDDLGLDKEQCDLYHHLMDKNADSVISYDEFFTWLHGGENFKTIADKTRYYYLQKAITIFHRYDTDSDMAIDKKEFHKLYKELGGNGKEGEKEMMNKIDIDHNGRISFEEFMRWLNWVPIEHLIVRKEEVQGK